MRNKISQREASRLKRRVVELEHQEERRRSAFVGEWPGGVEIMRCSWDKVDSPIPMAVRTARRLKHAVVAIGEESTGMIRFVALPLAKVCEK